MFQTFQSMNTNRRWKIKPRLLYKYLIPSSHSRGKLKLLMYAKDWNMSRFVLFLSIFLMTFVITKLYKMFENDICDTKLYQMSKNDPNTEIFTVFGQTKCHSLVICYEWMLNFSSLNNS